MRSSLLQIPQLLNCEISGLQPLAMSIHCLLLSAGIDRRRRFVQQQHRGLPQHHPGQADQLSLTEAQVAAWPLAAPTSSPGYYWGSEKKSSRFFWEGMSIPKFSKKSSNILEGVAMFPHPQKKSHSGHVVMPQGVGVPTFVGDLMLQFPGKC